jgi:hypothetical protein
MRSFKLVVACLLSFCRCSFIKDAIKSIIPIVGNLDDAANEATLLTREGRHFVRTSADTTHAVGNLIRNVDQTMVPPLACTAENVKQCSAELVETTRIFNDLVNIDLRLLVLAVIWSFVVVSMAVAGGHVRNMFRPS